MANDRLKIGSKQLEEFLALPKRCQEMFFYCLKMGTDFKDSNYKVDDFEYINKFSGCQSPIEKIFLYAFDIVSNSSNLRGLSLDTQVPITLNKKRYVADFMFDTSKCMFGKLHAVEKELKLVIECDGHNFHEKTKEQVRHDNERDYALKRAGYDVIHFSGSQIYGDPFRCAQQVIEYIFEKVGDVWILESEKKNCKHNRKGWWSKWQKLNG